MRHLTVSAFRQTILTAGLLIGLTVCVNAAGPAEVATFDQQNWNEPLNTTAGFDKASRAALLVYANTINHLPPVNEAQLLIDLRIKSLNRTSLDKWLDNERKRILHNYQLASANCQTDDWTCISPINDFVSLGNAAHTILEELANDLKPWYTGLTAFSQTYIAEQMRLAALFPKVTSEIDTFGAHEWTGNELNDRQFFLTFDDGPSKAGSNTDATLTMLEQQGKNATFFVLGKNLQARLESSATNTLDDLYAGQCVASHGWEHNSHARWDNWQNSIRNTHTLLRAALPETVVLPLFRPPYGQRKPDSGAFFVEEEIQVALWNIDSQDWQRKLDADAIGNRVITLMLIKRHGVLLFHDVHGKAHNTLPKIFSTLGKAVSWPDCQQVY